MRMRLAEKARLNTPHGQSMTEYAIIGILVVTVAIGGIQAVQNSMTGQMSQMANSMNHGQNATSPGGNLSSPVPNGLKLGASDIGGLGTGGSNCNGTCKDSHISISISEVKK